MKIAIDMMGVETPLKQIIKATRKFVRDHKDVEITLVGDKSVISPLIKANEFAIVSTSEVVRMDDHPIDALRKNQSSMYQAIQLVANHQVDGVLSGGSTACYITLTYLLLKPLIAGLKPGFMPFLPIGKNQIISLIDVGASINCEPQDLHRFAILANLYWQLVLNKQSPRIGLINIGSEKDKGFPLHSKTDDLLKADKNLNYIGYIEPKYILNNVTDIVLCDGYTGNILLKSTEGALTTFKQLLKSQYKKPWNYLGALFSIGVFSSIKKYLNYKDNAGAMVLGIKEPAVKVHGLADATQYYSGLRALYNMINSHFVAKAQKYFQDVTPKPRSK